MTAPARIRAVLVVAALVAFPGNGLSQTTGHLTERAVAAIDGHFAPFDGSNPGYVVGVMQGGGLRYAKGFGRANLDHDIPLRPTTVMNVASLSKQFTAAALAIQIRRGSVSLEDPVSRHIAEWPPQFSEVRVEHLVYMTSGLPEYYTLERPGSRDWGMDYFTVADAIAAVLAQESLQFEPGSRWAYNNSNYQVMAEIVVRTSGVEFSDFVRTEIFEPLGMNDSLVNDRLGQVIPGRATGYNRLENGFRQEIRRSPHYGGSGVFTTVRDLATWIGSLQSHELGGPELTALLLQVRRFDHDKANDAFGLVWGDYRGHRTVWYEGGDLGFSSYMAWLPDEDLSVIVLSNLGTGQAATHARAVLDILLGPA